jgi:DUF971 family protein
MLNNDSWSINFYLRDEASASEFCGQLVAIGATGASSHVRSRKFGVAMRPTTRSIMNECELSPDLSSLSITTSEGRRIILTAEKLRIGCKCAHCTRARFDGRFPQAFPGIAIVGVTDVGYGFNIAFSDGHDRGIYPQTYLSSLADS